MLFLDCFKKYIKKGKYFRNNEKSFTHYSYQNDILKFLKNRSMTYKGYDNDKDLEQWGNPYEYTLMNVNNS